MEKTSWLFLQFFVECKKFCLEIDKVGEKFQALHNAAFSARIHACRNYKLFEIFLFLSTVKLGYNDHGYNEFTFIANKTVPIFWSKMTS